MPSLVPSEWQYKSELCLPLLPTPHPLHPAPCLATWPETVCTWGCGQRLRGTAKPSPWAGPHLGAEPAPWALTQSLSQELCEVGGDGLWRHVSTKEVETWRGYVTWSGVGPGLLQIL